MEQSQTTGPTIVAIAIDGELTPPPPALAHIPFDRADRLPPVGLTRAGETDDSTDALTASRP